MELVDRFWSKVLKTDQCWIWVGARMKMKYGRDHYGIFCRDGNPRNKVLAHRISWELHHGTIPKGMLVCHKCDNPPCVRPDHLFIGTVGDNTHDSINKGRWACGENAGKVKLTELQVLEIIALPLSITTTEIARRYGIGHSQAQRIRAGTTWRHVPRS